MFEQPNGRCAHRSAQGRGQLPGIERMFRQAQRRAVLQILNRGVCLEGNCDAGERFQPAEECWIAFGAESGELSKFRRIARDRSAASIPAAAVEAPARLCPRSTTVTFAPRSFSSRAIARPINPAPITTMSGARVALERKTHLSHYPSSRSARRSCGNRYIVGRCVQMCAMGTYNQESPLAFDGFFASTRERNLHLIVQVKLRVKLCSKGAPARRKSTNEPIR